MPRAYHVEEFRGVRISLLSQHRDNDEVCFDTFWHLMNGRMDRVSGGVECDH